jgi:Lysyl oxidase
MRRSLLLSALVTSAVVAGCIVAEKRPTAPHEHGGGAVPVGSVYNDPTSVDTGGGRLPDLTVQASATQNSWRVKDEYISNNFCSAIEGGVSEGYRRLLRFTVTTPNVGNADVFVGDPRKHMDPNGDGSTADADGMFEFSTCHDHYHFQNYATYRLIDATGKEWRSAKRGFCMLDTDPYNQGTQTQVGSPNYMSCGTQSRSGFQGVSHGWADTYVWQLAGQYFVLDGGDGQAVIPPGQYTIEIHVNPPYAPDKKGNCPLVKGTDGMCHNFAESNYANNIGRATVIIPTHPGRDGYGPLKGQKDPTPEEETAKGA